MNRHYTIDTFTIAFRFMEVKHDLDINKTQLNALDYDQPSRYIIDDEVFYIVNRNIYYRFVRATIATITTIITKTNEHDVTLSSVALSCVTLSYVTLRYVKLRYYSTEAGLCH
ncbi:hypothetical protein HZH66_013527 [Vespula vulgaris]|uniref:Uncharacterized protein n=1 Tax=Vespula vulgaris TaxID=7454 RepID=A0A834MR60_VESVU|nr:hypothetical protein HZH66_013527 [Vespula vulgaris]